MSYPQLYTVHLQRIRQIHRFDEKGRALPVETRLIDERYHDLPLVTAQGYREKFGEQVVSISPTERGNDRRGSTARNEAFYSAGSGKTMPAARRENRAASVSKSSASTPAARRETGTYAGVVNTMMNETAR